MSGQAPKFRVARDHMTEAINAVFAVVRSLPADQAAYVAATEVANILRRAAGEAADLRAEAVGRIQDTEQLSLASLAVVIGLSKSRTQQFAEQSRRNRKREES